MSKSKYWCFTLNNYSEGELSVLRELVGGGAATYLVLGFEVGAEGTPHIQGYVELVNRKVLGGVKRIPGFARCHLEARRGSPSEAKAYCCKDGNFQEFGSLSEGQGHRTDLDSIISELRNGSRLEEVAMRHPETYCRYRNGLRDIASWCSPSERRKPVVYWIWGPPGTGKSRYAHSMDSGSMWSYGGDGWFDGYSGQDLAIFDDYCDDQSKSKSVPFGLFLKLLDRYPLQVPVKGGFVPWNPRRIVFTSNRPVHYLYEAVPQAQREAIWRRFDFVMHFD